jgi:hypothetical protein
MGVLENVPEREVKGPELPDDMAHVVDHYRRVKFSFCHTDGVAVLTPRKALQFAEVDSYVRLTGAELKPFEVSLLMDIDGIFESRGD